MKANMALNICLRVRDGLQSIELLGDGRAASISPSAPGCAWRNDGESVEPFRCAFVSDIGAMVEAARTAAAFHGLVHASALFTAPLPRIVEADMLPARSSDVPSVPFALADDGIGIDVAELAVNAGNVGIIGSAGRGKSTILALLAHRSRDILGLCVRWTRREDGRSSRRRYAITDGCGSPPNRHLPYPRICCGWWTMPTHCSIRSARTRYAHGSRTRWATTTSPSCSPWRPPSTSESPSIAARE